jgi:hypothetical protein
VVGPARKAGRGPRLVVCDGAQRHAHGEPARTAALGRYRNNLAGWREGDGLRISSSELVANGVAPGLDPAGVQETVDEVDPECPISDSLGNNVRITVTATLES